MCEYLVKIGTEKVRDFEKSFDIIYDKYVDKARSMGYSGELRIIKEHSKILIYITKYYDI